MRYSIFFKLLYVGLFIKTLFLLSEASVRKDIKDFTSINELRAYYENNNSDLYKARYIIKYLPSFLEKHGISTCPDWVESVAENSLYSSYGPLILESIKLIGKYKLSGNADRLYELFLTASNDYANYSTVMRFAIVRSLSQINGDMEKLKLIQLFNSFPEGLIRFREFGMLATSVSSLENLPANQERVSVTKTTQYLAEVDSEISKLDLSKIEDENEYTYLSDLRDRLIVINSNDSLLETGGKK